MFELKKAFTNNFELIFWLAALLALALSNPQQAPHFELCPFKLMGLQWCPGCGLGHSVSFLFHGKISQAVHAHWFGIPVLLILIHRVGILLSKVIVTFS